MNYHNITKDDMLNGDGLRVVLWVAGCSHHCGECQNPVTWNPESGLPFDENAKQEIMEQLSKDYISGITFSGGDPLHINNVSEIAKLCDEIKKNFPTKTIWLYTGYEWDEIICKYKHEFLQSIDVIVDGRFVQELADKNLKWKGSSNQRVIDVQKSLKEGKVVLHG